MDVTVEAALMTAAISIGGTVLTNAVAKYLSRKSEAAQIRATDGDAAKDIADAVSVLINPMRGELDAVRKDNDRMKGRLIAMEDEVANLKLDLRRVNDAFEYLVGVSRETFPDHVERAIKIRKGDA